MPTVIPTAADHPIANAMDRARLTWLHRHGKDGPARLLNVYKRDDGRLRWKPSGMPDEMWVGPPGTDRAPRDVLWFYAEVMHRPDLQVATAASLDWEHFAGVMFIGGSWALRRHEPDMPAEAFRAQVDQDAAWAKHRGVSTHPERIEIVNTYYADVEGRTALGTWPIRPADGEPEVILFEPDDPSPLEGNVPGAMRRIIDAYLSAREIRADIAARFDALDEEQQQALVAGLKGVERLPEDAVPSLDGAVDMPPADLYRRLADGADGA